MYGKHLLNDIFKCQPQTKQQMEKARPGNSFSEAGEVTVGQQGQEGFLEEEGHFEVDL